LRSCTPEVLQEIAHFLSVNGEGYGWRLEESNRNIKMAMTGDSADQFDFAAAARDFMVEMRTNLFTQLGLSEVEARERTMQELQVDVRNCEDVLCSPLPDGLRVLQPRAGGREFCDLCGEKLVVSSLDAIFQRGKLALAGAVSALRDGAHRRNWPFPALAAAVAISDDERRDGVTRADGSVARAAAALQELEVANAEVDQLRAALQRAQEGGLNSCAACGKAAASRCTSAFCCGGDGRASALLLALSIATSACAMAVVMRRRDARPLCSGASASSSPAGPPSACAPTAAGSCTTSGTASAPPGASAAAAPPPDAGPRSMVPAGVRARRFGAPGGWRGACGAYVIFAQKMRDSRLALGDCPYKELQHHQTTPCLTPYATATISG
jgi:hypothetical protein